MTLEVGEGVTWEVGECVMWEVRECVMWEISEVKGSITKPLCRWSV